MKLSLNHLAIALCAATLASCTGLMKKNDPTNDPLTTPPGGSRYLQDASAQPSADPNAPATTDPNAPATPPTPPNPNDSQPAADTKPPTPPTTSNAGGYPYAKPVPGKKGYVYSPFDDNKEHPQIIDVHDYAPGTKVRDPITQKIFIVP